MESSSRTFSLRAEDEAGLNTAVYLHLRGPFQDRVGLQFSFTYRLKFPSGRVEWLGEYGSNGLVTVQRGLPGIDLAGRWDAQEDGTYRIAPSRSCELARLETPEDWTCWVWRSHKCVHALSTV